MFRKARWRTLVHAISGTIKTVPAHLLAAIGLCLGMLVALSSSNAHAASEGVIALQPRILGQALAALEPPQSSQINLYFVGFAGSSTQDVFMKEVKAVATQFKQRFDTTGHSIVLINNRATVREDPIATRGSLAHVLHRIGTMIDPRRDIVFLYLSSHGSPDHELSVSFPPLSLSDIDPHDLRRMLDAAGIKRRVIVISACYSGGFIEPLKTDDSLIITAAAANRPSFGCSNQADYTYFGRAYFHDALRQTNSFAAAFRLAQPMIAARERREGYQPSNPQMFEGTNIARALADFEHQLSLSGALSVPPSIPPQNR